jgi:acyl carrier protein
VTQSSRSAVGKPSSLPSSVTSSSAPPDSDDVSQQLARLVQKRFEVSSAPSLDANLADLGLDSVLAIELANDIKKLFAVAVNLYALDETSTFRDLVRLVETDNRLTLESNSPAAHAPVQETLGPASTATAGPRVQGEHGNRPPPPRGLSKRAGVPMETVAWKHVDGLELCVDIYYPPEAAAGAPKRPIGRQADRGRYCAMAWTDIEPPSSGPGSPPSPRRRPHPVHAQGYPHEARQNVAQAGLPPRQRRLQALPRGDSCPGPYHGRGRRPCVGAIDIASSAARTSRRARGRQQGGGRGLVVRRPPGHDLGICGPDEGRAAPGHCGRILRHVRPRGRIYGTLPYPIHCCTHCFSSWVST